MEKLNPETPDLAQAQMEQLREFFPECVTEGPDGLAVDFDALRQALSSQIVEGPQERYRLDWPGKREAAAMANQPTDKTLRPARDESVDFDTTQNLFIEGDNLEALKLIQETYLGQVKMIYIDPPYNTGNDFIYRDDFKQAREDYEAESGVRDDEGNRLVANPESAGRFHSDWLSMMYPRLKIAKTLLADDGVIFISIDDGEVANLRRLCDEIFGAGNFVGNIIWNSTKSVTNTALISVSHTHTLVYARQKDYFIQNRTEFRLPESGDGFANPNNDPRGPWKADPFQVGGWRPNQQYTITNPNTGETYKPSAGNSWKNDLETFKKLLADDRIVFGVSGEAGPQRKRFLSEALSRGKVAKTIWSDVGTTTNGTSELNGLMTNRGLFTNPKPTSFLGRLLQLGTNKNDIILDFFAGSATTAHAVMQLNAEDGGNRRFIMVQLPEPCKEDTEAFKAGYKTIAEISKERIRRAGQKIVEGECHDDWNKDIGFRVLKVDESNLNAVRQTPDATSQESLLDAVENIKPDRSEEDLLFDVMMRWGVDLAAPVERREIDGKTVFLINEDDLVACFDPAVTEDFVKRLTDLKPLKIVFRDDAFASDDVKINTVQIFKQASPDTEVRSI